MTTSANGDVRPDRNSLGKASLVVGLTALILSFIPIIGFVSWLLAPLAILFGLISLRRPSKSLAIAGIITGGIAMFVCFAWINASKSVGEAMSADTFNKKGEVTDLSNAPIVNATVGGLWKELEENKIAAGQKYGGKRLEFNGERIANFAGDAANPAISIVGKSDDFLEHYVSASFAQADGAALAAKKKGEKISFVCTKIQETFGDGYSLTDCKIK